MKQILLGALAVSLLGACSGDGSNPFTTPTTTDPVAPITGIPDAVQSDVGTFSYDPATMTLTVTGLSLEAEPLSGTYTRNPALDRVGYEAYTAQESPLDRHVTAYVRSVNGTAATVAVTGGQFDQYFGGAVYTRNQAYTPPDLTPTTGLASYAGNYVGLTNIQNAGGNLLPLPPGTPPAFAPGQSAEVTGVILINADFADNVVNGAITNRVLVESATAVDDIALQSTAINGDGTFTGNVIQGTQTRGEYGGLFGGTGATEVAGAIFAEEHMTSPGIIDEEEFGIFVLVQCGQPGADPLCD